MKNPVHSGVIVREDCMKPLNLSVTECAKMLGVTRQTLSSLVNAKASVSTQRHRFPLKWPAGCQGHSVRLREPGLECSRLLISPSRENRNEKIKS